MSENITKEKIGLVKSKIRLIDAIKQTHYLLSDQNESQMELQNLDTSLTAVKILLQKHLSMLENNEYVRDVAEFELTDEDLEK